MDVRKSSHTQYFVYFYRLNSLLPNVVDSILAYVHSIPQYIICIHVFEILIHRSEQSQFSPLGLDSTYKTNEQTLLIKVQKQLAGGRRKNSFTSKVIITIKGSLMAIICQNYKLQESIQKLLNFLNKKKSKQVKNVKNNKAKIYNLASCYFRK